MQIKDKIILISKRFMLDDRKEDKDIYFVIALRLDISKEERLPPFSDRFYQEAQSGLTYENPDYIGEFVLFKSQEAFDRYS